MTEEIEIILIEDSDDDAMLTTRALKTSRLANSLIRLRNGEDALNFFFNNSLCEGKTFSKASKVILLDLKMPKIGGIEVLKKIKSDEKTKCIPVVVLTSSNEDPDIKTCYELGANSYIVKPVDYNNFLKTVVGLGMYWSVLNKT